MEKDSEQSEQKDRARSASVRPSRQASTSAPAKRLASSDGHHDRSARIKSLGVAFVVLLSLFAGFLGGMLGSGNMNVVSNANPSTQKKVISSQSQLISTVANNVSPSVVSVDVTSQQARAGGFGLFGFSQPTVQKQRSAGTGIIISSSGYIITNRHVVPKGTTKVSVTLSDGTQFRHVKVVGRTSAKSSLDIAFLKITDKKGHKLKPASLGDSGSMKVGDKVIAIGNALGQFQNTVTTGIISGYGRSVQAGSESGNKVETLQDLFQTDAAINHGNSGGPLVNVDGKVIGINTAIAGNAQNIGFAIPINDVKGLIHQVLSTGHFKQPFLGVRYVPITNSVAKRLDLKVDRGAYILPKGQNGGQPSVVPGSPADKAGLKPKDIITSVNGTKVNDRHSLTSLLDQYTPSKTVKLSIIRGGKHKTISATLSTVPKS